MISTCALCGGQDLEQVFIKKGYSLVRCGNCSLIFVSNPPSAKEIRKMYSPRGGYQTKYRECASERERFMIHSRRNFDFFKRHASRGSILDVGCSIGGFLSLCEGERVGLEINPATRIVAKERFNLKEVYDCTLVEFHRRYSDRKFDNVTLWDVFEHLPSPNRVLETTRKVLRPGGLLFIGTSNADGLFARISFILRDVFGWYHPEPPHHLFQYGVRTLTEILRKHSFEVLKTKVFPASYERKRSTLSLDSLKGQLYVLLLGPIDLLAKRLGDGDMMTLVARR